MSDLAIDYSRLADSLNRYRTLSEEKQNLWVEQFRQHLALTPTSRMIDVGCGTGRFALALRRRLGCSVLGLDVSSAMLAKACANDGTGIKWMQGCAEALPLASGSMDACLLSQVVHHFGNKQQAFNEIYRILRAGGRIGIRYSSHAELRALPDYRFFPTALLKDLERVPDTPAVRAMLGEAGFHGIEERTVRQEFFESSQDYLDKLRNRYASVLFLIPEEEYQRGLREAVEYFTRHEIQENEKNADMTFLVGIK